MSGHLKAFAKGVPVEICMSVQKGLPFVATEYMEMIIMGILATAQTKYPVIICHYVVMANHIHLIIIPLDGADVTAFIDYFKTETAHALNRLLDRQGESFWIAGYDSPIILSAQRFLNRMLYLYSNPVSAGLVTSIKHYPGLNSFGALLKTEERKFWKRISRTRIGRLARGTLSIGYQKAMKESFLESKTPECELKIEPWAWLECFSASKEWKIEDVRARFLNSLEENEKIERAKHKSFLGRDKLINRDIHTAYRSERSGKKMLCMSDCPEQCKQVVFWLKSQGKLARLAYQQRRAGLSSALPPPGFFLPGGALLSNLIALPFFL